LAQTTGKWDGRKRGGSHSPTDVIALRLSEAAAAQTSLAFDVGQDGAYELWADAALEGVSGCTRRRSTHRCPRRQPDRLLLGHFGLAQGAHRLSLSGKLPRTPWRNAFLLRRVQPPAAPAPTVQFEKITPSRYLVHVSGATAPFLLVFDEPITMTGKQRWTAGDCRMINMS